MSVDNINGVQIHSMVVGDQGPLLIMLHGLVSGSVATWYFRFAPSLAKRYRVVLYDMRGHGKSERVSSGFDIDTMAEDLQALIRFYQRKFDLVDEPVHLVGHSYGALVALHYAINADLSGSAPIKSLALVDAPLPASHFIYPSLKMISGDRMVDKMVAELTDHLQVTGSRRQNKLREHIHYLFMETSITEDVSKSEDYSAETLGKLDIPVLLVYGEFSDCHPVGVRLAKALPDARLAVIPCGHYITSEAPQELVAELDQFFLGDFDG